jgi:hypothetical protein
METAVVMGQQPPGQFDDVTWTTVLGPFSCFGHVFSIRTTSSEMGDFLDRLFAPMGCRTSAQPTVFSLVPPTARTQGTVHRDQEPLLTSKVAWRLLGTLIWAINREVIQPDRVRVILHAAGADLDGHSVLLPAPMESGKTTLVTGLLERGLGYLSDEAIELLPDGTATGYPKPLSIDPGSWEVLAHLAPQVPTSVRPYLERQWQVPADSIANIVSGSRPALVVFPTYRAHAVTELTRLSPATALRLAVECTFGPAGAMVSTTQVRRLVALLASVPVYQLTSSTLDEACSAVVDALGQAVTRRSPS